MDRTQVQCTYPTFKSSFYTWIYRIAINLAKNFVKKPAYTMVTKEMSLVAFWYHHFLHKSNKGKMHHSEEA